MNEQLQNELEEQARLLGMSAERECDLRGEIKRLERERDAERALAEMYRRKCSKLRSEHDSLQEQLDAAIMLGKMQERRHAREFEQVREQYRLSSVCRELKAENKKLKQQQP